MDALEKSKQLTVLKDEAEDHREKAEGTSSALDELIAEIKELSTEDREALAEWFNEAKQSEQAAEQTEEQRRQLIATNTAGKVAVTTTPDRVVLTESEVAGIQNGEERPVMGYGGHNGN